MSGTGKDGAGHAGSSGLEGGALGVGAALRAARERRGLTLEEVAGVIRCTARQVRFLEEGRTGDLPPHPYARGLVAAYATLVNLETGTAVREWGRPTGDGQAGRRSLFHVPVPPQSSWRDWAVPIACACLTAAYLVFGALQRPSPVGMPAPRPAPRAEPRPLPQPEVESAPAAAPASVQDDWGLTLTVRSEGSSWVEYAADGEGQRRQELGPGHLLELHAHRRLGLALGDAGAVRLTLNGRELGFIGEKGEARAGIVFEAPSAGATGESGAGGRAGR